MVLAYDAIPAGKRAPERAIVPRFSLAERDRRHALVRAAMAAAGIDVLLLPGATSRWEQSMADSRYITGIGGFGTETFTVFPLKDHPTAYVFNRANWWQSLLDWIDDVRDGRNRWAENAIERLGEIGFKRGTIGVSGLAGPLRSPDGLIPFTTIDRIAKAFPAAKIVNATSLIQDVRAIKSAEEIVMIGKAAAIAEKMVASLGKAKPGVTEKNLYGEMLRILVSEGGEVPAMIIVGSGPDISHGQFTPTERTLRRGDLVIGEIEGRYCGYSAQIIAALVLGKAKPAYREMMRVSAAAFEAVVAEMKPGATMGLVMDTYRKAVEREGKGRCVGAYPLMHARGLGDESPAILSQDELRQFEHFPLQEGMVFVVKPRVTVAGSPFVGQVGDTVVVTATGARRLGKRKLGLTEVAIKVPT